MANKGKRVTELNEVELNSLRDEDYMYISTGNGKSDGKVKLSTLREYFTKNSLAFGSN